jgi:hypothetical protein
MKHGVKAAATTLIGFNIKAGGGDVDSKNATLE